jgi:hypothetical protein
MKKYILIILAVMFLSSCDNQYITEVNTFSQPYTLKKGTPQWWRSGTDALGDLYFYYTVEVPQLTNTVINYGSLNTYLRYMPEGTSKEALSPLPFSDFITARGYKWEEQLTVEYQPQKVTFILKTDDHEDMDPAYNDYTFVVRFLW